MRLDELIWETKVFVSRWRHRLTFLAAAPKVYLNPLEIFWARLRRSEVILQLRDGRRYYARPASTDLAVLNEAVILDPYLKPGFVHIPKGGTILDIGANIGDFTIQAAKGSNAVVHAIEPIIAHCESIKKQCDLNQLSNVKIHRLALGGSKGTISIHTEGGQSSAYWGSGATEEVPVETLEKFLELNEITEIELLKMDCEGAEWDIFPVSEAVLPRIHQICMEFHNGKLDHTWLSGWLRERGFEVETTGAGWNGLLWAWRKTPVQPASAATA